MTPPPVGPWKGIEAIRRACRDPTPPDPLGARAARDAGPGAWAPRTGRARTQHRLATPPRPLRQRSSRDQSRDFPHCRQPTGAGENGRAHSRRHRQPRRPTARRRTLCPSRGPSGRTLQTPSARSEESPQTRLGPPQGDSSHGRPWSATPEAGETAHPPALHPNHARPSRPAPVGPGAVGQGPLTELHRSLNSPQLAPSGAASGPSRVNASLA